MDVDKPEYFDRYFDEEDENKEKPRSGEQKDNLNIPEIDEREYFDESLFKEEKPFDEPSTPDALAEDTKEQTVTEFPPTGAEPKPEFKPKVEAPAAPPMQSPLISQKPELSEYDYEDSKMQGINWKPLLIWSTVIIVIVVAGYFGYNWYFADGEEPGAEETQTTLSPQEQMRIEQEKKKIAFIKNIVGEKKSKLNNFSNLTNLKTAGISYSSVLLYDNSFKFEIFGQTRDDIAKYNQNLKNKRHDSNYKIVTVDSRPGSNGGVFALYNLEMSQEQGGGTQQPDPQIDNNIQNTIQNLVNTNKLKLINERIISRKSVDQFELIREEIQCTGSETDCVKLLNDLNTANNNFDVHKISLIPSNQKNIKNSKYNLLIIFDFYV